MSIIRTFTGLRFDPLAPSEKDIRIEDIAHALSLLCRANGHFSDFFSVARHSLNCTKEAKARELSVRIRLACLLHDASEAYISDITRPVKVGLPEYLVIEERMQETIYRCFGLPDLNLDELEFMGDIDDAMMYHEFLYYTGERVFETEPVLLSTPCFNALPFAEAEAEFLSAARELVEEIKKPR